MGGALSVQTVFLFFLIHGLSVLPTDAAVTTVSPIQVFQIINSTC